MYARKRTTGKRTRGGLGRPALWVVAALALLPVACGDEGITDPETTESRGGPQEPGKVTDLEAVEVTGSSVTLTWTEVHDGRNKPADYQVRYAHTPIYPGWGEATVVEDGDCADPVEGTEIGTTITCTVTGLEADTEYDFRLVSFREGGNWRVYGDLSNIATARTAGSSDDDGEVGEATDECADPRSGWIWCDDFEENRLDGYFEYVDGDGSFERVQGVGTGGSYGMRMRWDEGQVSGGRLWLAFGKTPQSYFEPVDEGTAVHRDVYWRVYVRNAPDWTGGGGYKLSRATSFASSTSWAQAMIAHVWSGGSGEEDHLLIDPASGTDEAGTLLTTTYNDFENFRWLGRDVSETPLFGDDHVGEWHCVEARARLNDPGQENGVFELWIDGELEARRTGLNWVGSFDEYGINALALENYWDGGAPRAQERYFDNLVVSSEPIGCLGEEPPPPPEDDEELADPEQVTDLSVAGTTESSVTLTWTEVDDGTGGPADYTVRYLPTPFEDGWGEATVVTDGECGSPVEGTEVGTEITCPVNGLEEDTSYDFRLVSYRWEEDGSRVFGELSNIATGETEFVVTDPEQVTDLSVAGTTESSVTLTWTEVDDGTGGPADYTVRYLPTPFEDGWGEATIVTDGECGSPVEGTAVGTEITCPVNGLEEDTSYDFRLVSYRWEEDGSRVFGELSNVATGETASSDGPSGLYPNEPSGLAELTERDFELLEEDDWVLRHADRELLSITTDLTAPVGGSTVGYMHYPAGWEGGAAPAGTERRNLEGKEARRLYVSLWLKISDNWQGHPSNINKIMYFWIHDDGAVYLNYRTQGDGPVTTSVMHRHGPDPSEQRRANLNDVPIERGKWHRWEVVLVSNTGDAYDGELHWWIDGVKAGEHTSIRFGDASQSEFWQTVSWHPVWGGIDGEILEDQYMSMARVYVSGGG